MAIVVEVQQVTDGIFRIVTRQIVEDETDPDFEALQRVADESAAEAFRMMEVRDIIKVLLERTKLERREKEVIALFLSGLELIDIAAKLKISRQAVNEAFRRAIQRFRETAQRLGINP